MAHRWLHDAFGLTLNQREVDFVIPDLDADLPLCLDPFLLFKSRRPELRAAHDFLISLFAEAFSAFRSHDTARVRQIIDFPEVKELRFGYAKGSIRVSGSGSALSTALIESLEGSPDYLARGLKHVEELQLLTDGLVSEDRLSDTTANVLKEFLVSYTADQSRTWGLPITRGVPLHHLWDADSHDWVDRYVDLPVDPNTGVPILLAPRWVVRRLPWINYDDFLKTDLAPFLGARLRGAVRSSVPKPRAITVTRQNMKLMDGYIRRKESTAAQAQPDAPPLLAVSPPLCNESLAALLALVPGRSGAHEYQRLALQVMNCLVEPELVDGQEQVRTDSGVEIRDLVFANNSDLPFLTYLMHTYGNMFLVVELKNVKAIETDDINQLANYLGDPLGRCGILLSREPLSRAMQAKVRATYVKMSPRKAIIAISDADLQIMVQMKQSGSRHPLDHLQRKYRELVQSID